MLLELSINHKAVPGWPCEIVREPFLSLTPPCVPATAALFLLF